MRTAIWGVTAALLAVSALRAIAKDPAEAVSAPPRRTSQSATTRPADLPEGWFAETPKTNQKVKPQTVIRAMVIPLRGPISTTTFDVLKRKVGRCHSAASELVILDIDSPGGRSDAMESIVRLVLDELKDSYVVAYVHPQALSAAAIISLACDEIALSPTAVIGDAMPIMVGPEGIIAIPEKERGKIESAALAEIRVLAKRNGYSQVLCEAMITITKEVWLVRNRKTMELRAVDASEWRGRASGSPPTTQPAVAVERESKTEWEYIKTIVDSTKLVTMTADEAVFLGFGKHICETLNDLKGPYNIQGEMTVLRHTWSEELVDFLTSPPVMGFLFFTALLCGYIEMHTPGFGVAGTIAIACLALVFGSGFLVGLAAWWEIALFVVGLVLIGIEIFVTPGHGVLGITGLICCIAALLAMIVPNAPDKLPIPKSDLDWSVFTNGLLALMIGFILACLAAALVARYLPKAPIASRLILNAPTVGGAGLAGEGAPWGEVTVGAVGTVERACRPVGQVRFADALVDAVADGAFIPAGTKVQAVKIEGNRIVVEPLA